MKNATIFPFFVLLLFMQLSGCSREKEKDCKSLLSQQPYMFKHRQQSNMNLDSVKHDYDILQECGNLDSIDGVIFQGSMIGQLVISKRNKENNNDEITYQSLIDLISEFKTNHTARYQKLRNWTIARLEIEKTPVELSKFESIRPKLNTIGLTNEEINDFKSFLGANDKTWNYKQALTVFIQSQNSNASSNQPLDFPKLETLEKLLADAKIANKNCLVYFSCYGCVNARKFEHQALTNPEIQQLIQENFIYAVALVDDPQKALGETETNGKKYSQIQKQKFNSVSQPSLYILSPEGKIITSWSYDDEANTFQRFLEKGIKK